MNSHRFELTPMDTYLFRDGRPFEMRRARPLSPHPPAATLYGALRHMLLEQYGVAYDAYRRNVVPEEIKEVLGPRDGIGALRVAGPFLRYAGTTHLAWPADLIAQKQYYLYQRPGMVAGGASYPAGMSPLALFQAGESSPFTGSVVSHESPDHLAASAWWAGEELSDYLLGKDFRAYAGARVAKLEPHAGITRQNETLTAADGQLFTVDFTRLADGSCFEFAIEQGGELFPACWNSSVGGERRPFLLAKTEGHSSDALRDVIRSVIASQAKDGAVCFRLYLATAAKFGRSWRPEIFAGECTWADNGITYRLESAAMARGPVHSGWSYASGGARSSIRTIPAGSVYFLSAHSELDAEALAERIFERFWFQPGLLEDNNEDRKMGFARTLIGVWNQ